MKNIHILPTDKPSRLVKFFTNKFHLCKEILPIQDEEQYQNIYITSDEEIKEGDWVYSENRNKVCKVTGVSKWSHKNDYSIDLDNENYYIHNSYCKKIVLTTDQNLIKDDVQAIDDDFLEWFIENPSCEFVKVENISLDNVIEEWWQDLSNEELIDVYKKTDNFRLGGWGHDIGPTQEDVEDMYLEIHNLNIKQLKDNYYKIIIPKEEPKQNSCDIIFETASLFDNEQETLEEAKQRILDSNFMTLNDAYIFEMGVRWQAKRMYNEEDLHNAFYNGWLYRGETYSFPEAKKEWLKNLNK